MRPSVFVIVLVFGFRLRSRTSARIVAVTLLGIAKEYVKLLFRCEIEGVRFVEVPDFGPSAWCGVFCHVESIGEMGLKVKRFSAVAAAIVVTATAALPAFVPIKALQFTLVNVWVPLIGGIFTIHTDWVVEGCFAFFVAPASVVVSHVYRIAQNARKATDFFRFDENFFCKKNLTPAKPVFMRVRKAPLKLLNIKDLRAHAPPADVSS